MHTTVTSPPPPVSALALESKVAFLRQPSSFPEPAYRVEAVETHMSWVFLTDGFAYKLKKPVRYDFLDFSTLEARRGYCDEELRLNRRLAPDVYLGLVALVLNADGHLQLGGEGSVIDWLVKMRRLPMQRMLDYAIRHGTVSAQDIDRVAARLAGFYRSCAPIAIEPEEYRRRFLVHIDAHQQELTQSAYRLPAARINDVCAALRKALQDIAASLDERVRAGKIVEGHGDLRPEHVCLNPELSIIDCLEFSRDLRITDACDEIGYLALECERLGARSLGETLMRNYRDLSNDRPAAALVHFYQSYRALLRATIAIRHVNEDQFRYSPEWTRRALAYLTLAERHVARCH
jgi:aminoglycoside phosphotransferase family enzyme